MMFQSHVLLGVLLFIVFKGLFFGGNEVVFFFLVMLGSILPDIDSQHSKVNRWSGIFGVVIAFFFKHRGVFHSLPIYLGLFFLMREWIGVYYASGLFLGYLAHIIGDGISKEGVKPFYPFSFFHFRGPMRVGGWLEKIIFVVMFGLIVWQFT